MDCCDVNGLRRVFRGRVVAQELRAFRRRGLDRRQRALVAAAGDPAGAQLLDIGCGIAAPSLTLLGRGAEGADLVDVSADYLAAARQLAQDLGLASRVAVHQGDFVTLALPPADIVLLDRVVCCYPDLDTLLEKAARHSRRRLVLSYPRPQWWLRPLLRVLNLGMALLGRDYRAYLHPPAAIHRAATSAGHRRVDSRPLGMWQLEVYEREG